MNANTNWNQMIEDHEIVLLRGDICLGSPQSFSLEEKKRICADLEASTAAIDAALKADFESLPPEAQSILLDMLCASGCMTPEFWKETLIGKMPDSVEMLEAVRPQSKQILSIGADELLSAPIETLSRANPRIKYVS